MKRLLNKITDRLADSALLEMGVDVKTVEELHTIPATESRVSVPFFQSAIDTLADAAMLEEGIDIFSNYRDVEKSSRTPAGAGYRASRRLSVW